LAKRVIQYRNASFSISYEILNRNQEKIITFLHGWGSSKLLMKNSFSKLFPDFQHLYIDLIGFGESGDAHFPLTSFDYKNILEIFFQELNMKSEIIVGHSFGGKIATLLNPPTLILLSSAGIITKKRLTVQIKIAIFKVLKSLKLNFLRNIFVSEDGKNLSQNMYETFKNVIEENFDEVFQSRQNGKTFIFWGIDDQATSLSSGKKINSLIPNSIFFEMSGDHFFFINQADKIFQITKG
jgi:pimeloyl-ACP methyl ester carboxylesterase